MYDFEAELWPSKSHPSVCFVAFAESIEVGDRVAITLELVDG